MGIWLEITTLIVPEVNDSPEELQELANFIYEDLGPETPWHLSRFFPQYQMIDREPTGEGILQQTKEMGEEIGLHYIYIGNVLGRYSTNCRKCGKELISRSGYSPNLTGLTAEGTCENCGTSLDGVGLSHI